MLTIAMRLPKIESAETVLPSVDGMLEHYHLEILIPIVCQDLLIVLEPQYLAGAHLQE